MVRFVLLGSLAASFFSVTFILNRSMSLDGGHWFWTGALRYLYMFFLLSVWVIARNGVSGYRAVWQEFFRHYGFWLFAGTIGFGFFYAPLAYASVFTPGWIVAVTFMSTILCNILVLRIFGKTVPMSGVLFLMMIFVGILLVNYELILHESLSVVLLGGIPVLVSAFSYPFGNQLVGEALGGNFRILPHLNDPVVKSAPARVLLLTVGTVPFWILLGLMVQPPEPSGGQWLQTFIVALSSGVIATSLFLYARHAATKAYEIATVDACQSLEVVFALVGEVLVLGAPWPAFTGWLGVGFTLGGLVLMTLLGRKK